MKSRRIKAVKEMARRRGTEMSSRFRINLFIALDPW